MLSEENAGKFQLGTETVTPKVLDSPILEFWDRTHESDTQRVAVVPDSLTLTCTDEKVVINPTPTIEI